LNEDDGAYYAVSYDFIDNKLDEVQYSIGAKNEKTV